MKTKFEGRVWKLGNHINTDVIYPGKYLPLLDSAEMAEHALEGIDPEFPKKIGQGDIIVAGMNFGCGSSREQAAECLKGAGIACVIAGSFARIFFRNAINIGLPVVESREAWDVVETGDSIAVDFGAGIIQTRKGSFRFPPLPPMIMEILEAGGLIEQVKKKISEKK